VRRELGDAARRHLARILLGDRRIEMRRVDVHARTGLQQEHRREAGQQGQDREGIEQAHRLQERLADFARVVQRGDAADDDRWRRTDDEADRKCLGAYAANRSSMLQFAMQLDSSSSVPDQSLRRRVIAMRC
jgi:hypothetical protein